MASATRPLTTRDTILLITHAAGDEVEGRTVMQKLAYFSALGFGASLGHRPHFYGPYSAKVEDAVANAVFAGELNETVERMAGWHGGPDLRKYTYRLTQSGRQRVDLLIENNSSEWDLIRDSVNAVKNVLPSLDQKTLSSAAKTYLIVSESGGPIPTSDIPAMAQQLGWELSSSQVQTTVDLLKRLGLLVDPSPDAV